MTCIGNIPCTGGEVMVGIWLDMNDILPFR